MRKFSQILKQSLWQVLGKIVTAFSTFIILGMVARNYGKEGTGVFTLTLTYLAIFYLLSDFGFNAHVLRKLKGQNSNVKAEWQKLLGTRLVWSGALVILAVGLLPLWPFATPLFSQAVVFGSLAIIGSGVFITCNLIFQSKLRYDLSILASGIGTLVGLAVITWQVTTEQPIPYLITGHLAGWIVIAVVSLFLVKKLLKEVGRNNPIFDLAYALNLFKKSWPIAATLLVNVVYFRADSFMIAYFKGVADAGVYNVAYSVFQSALVLPTFIMNAYYPFMLKSLGKVKYLGVGLLGLSIFGTLSTLVLAPFIVGILTGSGFAGSIDSLRILSLGFPAYFLSSLLMWILIAKGSYKSTLLLYTSGMIFNLILNFIYIPKYSFMAASWVTVISEYFILLMQVTALSLNVNKLSLRAISAAIFHGLGRSPRR